MRAVAGSTRMTVAHPRDGRIGPVYVAQIKAVGVVVEFSDGAIQPAAVLDIFNVDLSIGPAFQRDVPS